MREIHAIANMKIIWISLFVFMKGKAQAQKC